MTKIHPNTTHGGRYTPEYRIWSLMKNRCCNPNDAKFKHYGGRGICVCPQWLNDFSRFYEDMGPRPKNLTVERRDNTQGYTPSNCYWASRKIQANNRRSSRHISYKGESKTIAMWAEYLGVSYFLLYNRLNKLNWTIERAFTLPVDTKYRNL